MTTIIEIESNSNKKLEKSFNNAVGCNGATCISLDKIVDTTLNYNTDQNFRDHDALCDKNYGKNGNVMQSSDVKINLTNDKNVFPNEVISKKTISYDDNPHFLFAKDGTCLDGNFSNNDVTKRDKSKEKVELLTTNNDSHKIRDSSCVPDDYVKNKWTLPTSELKEKEGIKDKTHLADVSGNVAITLEKIPVSKMDINEIHVEGSQEAIKNNDNINFQNQEAICDESNIQKNNMIEILVVSEAGKEDRSYRGTSKFDINQNTGIDYNDNRIKDVVQIQASNNADQQKTVESYEIGQSGCIHDSSVKGELPLHNSGYKGEENNECSYYESKISRPKIGFIYGNDSNRSYRDDHCAADTVVPECYSDDNILERCDIQSKAVNDFELTCDNGENDIAQDFPLRNSNFRGKGKKGRGSGNPGNARSNGTNHVTWKDNNCKSQQKRAQYKENRNNNWNKNNNGKDNNNEPIQSLENVDDENPDQIHNNSKKWQYYEKNNYDKGNDNNQKNNKCNNKSSNNNNNSNSNKKGKKNNNNGGNEDPGVRISKFVITIFNGIFKTRIIQPLDSIIIKFHYRAAALIFLFMFFLVWHKFFSPNPIECINASVYDSKIPDVLKNICLSYSFLKIEGNREYQLYYRWVHYSFLLLAILFYAPRYIMKHWGSPRFRKLVNELNSNSLWYNADYNNGLHETLTYMAENLGTHSSYFFSFVFMHLLCIAISGISFFFIDFELQGKFITLIDAFPLNRNFANFTDPLSSAFPPFVTCMIEPPMNMTNKRSEQFNCHFTLMELYEKLFVFLWFFIQILVVIGFLKLIFLGIQYAPLPAIRQYLLRTSVHSQNIRSVKSVLLRKLDVGDFFILHSVKEHFNVFDFCLLLHGIKILIETREKTDSFLGSKENMSEFINHVMTEIENGEIHSELQLDTKLFAFWLKKLK